MKESLKRLLKHCFEVLISDPVVKMVCRDMDGGGEFVRVERGYVETTQFCCETKILKSKVFINLEK